MQDIIIQALYEHSYNFYEVCGPSYYAEGQKLLLGNINYAVRR